MGVISDQLLYIQYFLKPWVRINHVKDVYSLFGSLFWLPRVLIGSLFPFIFFLDTVHAENLGRILLDKTRNSGAENYGILIRLSADWMGKVDYESEIFLIQRYITLWKGTTASVDIISLSSKLFHDSCFKPAERRKYFFRYSVYVGKNSFDLKQVAIISAETCQMVLNLILASICIEKNWGDEKILVIPVTWQISAQPLVDSYQNFKSC